MKTDRGQYLKVLCADGEDQFQLLESVLQCGIKQVQIGKFHRAQGKDFYVTDVILHLKDDQVFHSELALDLDPNDTEPQMAIDLCTYALLDAANDRYREGQVPQWLQDLERQCMVRTIEWI